MLADAARALARRLPFRPAPAQAFPHDMEPGFRPIHDRARPFTMTPMERMYALYQAVRHVARNDVPGDVVECGVWKGGSSMVAALALQELGQRDRRLWLYDTYAGMSEPTEKDVRATNREDARQKWARMRQGDHNDWCYSSLDEVRANLLSTGYPEDRLAFVKGKVEDTIPGRMPERIAILRLDTDWYESTRHEMEHLYPRLSPGGVLLLDDYGHWAGARQAVDEYFAANPEPILLHRVDASARIGVRPMAPARRS